MEFQNVLTPGGLMQTVDVLCDDGLEIAEPLPSRQDGMSVIRLGSGEVLMCDGFLSPIFMPRGGAAQKVVKIHGLIRGPDSRGRAKVGNAAFRTNPRTREGDDPLGLLQPAGDELEGVFRHGQSTFQNVAKSQLTWSEANVNTGQNIENSHVSQPPRDWPSVCYLRNQRNLNESVGN